MSMLFWALLFFSYCLLSHSWVISKYFTTTQGRKPSIRTHLWKFQGCPLISWPNHLPVFRFLAPQRGDMQWYQGKKWQVYIHTYFIFSGKPWTRFFIDPRVHKKLLRKEGKKLLPTLSSGVSNLAVDTLRPFMLQMISASHQWWNIMKRKFCYRCLTQFFHLPKQFNTC